MIPNHQDFISFLANYLPANGLTKMQIIRIADILMHGGDGDSEKAVPDVKTPLEIVQDRIRELEQKVNSLQEDLDNANEALSSCEDELREYHNRD